MAELHYTPDQRLAFFKAAEELMQHMNLPGRTDQVIDHALRGSWSDTASLWNEKYVYARQYIKDLNDSAGRGVYCRMYNTVVALASLVKNDAEIDGRVTVFISSRTHRPMSIITADIAEQRNLIHVAKVVNDDEIARVLAEVLNTVGQQSQQKTPVSETHSADYESGNSPTSDDSDDEPDIVPSDDSHDENTVDVYTEAQSNGDIVSDEPEIPVAESPDDIIRERSQRWREYREQQSRGLRDGSVDAEQFWAEGESPYNASEPVTITISDGVTVNTHMYGDDTRSAAVHRINKVLLDRALKVVSERLRSHGVVVRSSSGGNEIPRNVLINMLLLNVVGDLEGVDVSESNRLIGLAADAVDARFDEVQTQLAELSAQGANTDKQVRDLINRMMYAQESITTTQMLLSAFFIERVGGQRYQVIPKGGDVQHLNVNVGPVRDVISRATEGTRAYIKGEKERQGRQESQHIR